MVRGKLHQVVETNASGGAVVVHRWKGDVMERKIKVVKLNDDLQEMLISSVRYALGRRTYMVEWTVKYITPLLPDFYDKELGVMRKDVEEWLSRYSQGEPEDILNEWKRFAKRLQEEVERRESCEKSI